MKIKYWIMFFMLVAGITLSSCVKHDNVYKKTERTADLTVPPGFDWASSRVVVLPVHSPVATFASFFLDETCSAEHQIAALQIPQGETAFRFDVPNEVKSIYVRYTSADGEVITVKSLIKNIHTKAVEGAADVMFFDQPQLASSENTQFINIPNGNGYGTLMFEDTWPDTGDFDFNDMVINYRIVPTYSFEGINPEAPGNSPGNDIIIKVSLRIRALGGTLPYDFAFLLGRTLSHEGSGLEESHLSDIIDFKTTHSGITVEKLEGAGFPGVIVKGLDAVRGSGYYNTISNPDEGVSLSFKIRIKGTVEEQANRMQNNVFTDPRAFDYFLINEENHKEIHLIGFAPSALFAGYDTENTSGGTYYYQNSHGLVWGLKAPGEIGWATEKQDIRNVYTQFGQWVTEGGYTIGPNGADPLLWYKYHTEENYIKP